MFGTTWTVSHHALRHATSPERPAAAGGRRWSSRTLTRYTNHRVDDSRLAQDERGWPGRPRTMLEDTRNMWDTPQDIPRHAQGGARHTQDDQRQSHDDEGQ